MSMFERHYGNKIKLDFVTPTVAINDPIVNLVFFIQWRCDIKTFMTLIL